MFFGVVTLYILHLSAGKRFYRFTRETNSNNNKSFIIHYIDLLQYFTRPGFSNGYPRLVV